MTRQTKDERGIAMALFALWLTAITAIAAIAIEVGRLTDTATEVQVAADAAALAAAEKMVDGGDAGTASAAAWRVAHQNSTDGHGPAASEVGLEGGTYTPLTGFGAGVETNAVRATVTIPRVRFILASIFGGPTATVSKRAVATYECCGHAQPTAPIAIGDCMLAQYLDGLQCSVTGHTLVLQPQPTQNACWTADPTTAPAWMPPECGGGRGPLLSAGGTTTLFNGNMTPILRQFQSCVDHGVHDYVIPIVKCPILNCNSGAADVVGFATMHIARSSDIVASGGGGITFTQICNNRAACTAGNATPGVTECFGTGNATLVDDRG